MKSKSPHHKTISAKTVTWKSKSHVGIGLNTLLGKAAVSQVQPSPRKRLQPRCQGQSAQDQRTVYLLTIVRATRVS